MPPSAAAAPTSRGQSPRALIARPPGVRAVGHGERPPPAGTSLRVRTGSPAGCTKNGQPAPVALAARPALRYPCRTLPPRAPPDPPFAAVSTLASRGRQPPEDAKLSPLRGLTPPA